jgi:hypothetical protein
MRALNLGPAAAGDAVEARDEQLLRYVERHLPDAFGKFGFDVHHLGVYGFGVEPLVARWSKLPVEPRTLEGGTGAVRRGVVEDHAVIEEPPVMGQPVGQQQLLVVDVADDH